MIKKVILAIFLISYQGQGLAAPSYVHTTRVEQIASLKAKLAHLRAEKVMLQKTFQLNTQEKCTLAQSLSLVYSFGFLGKILGILTERNSWYLTNGYIGIILLYCWSRVLRYVFLTGDIKVLEEEIENLQLLPVK